MKSQEDGKIMWRWWKKPRKIVVGAAVYRYTLADHPQYRELRVYREDSKQPAFRLRLTWPECWAIDLFRPKAAAFVISWYEGTGRGGSNPIHLQNEPELLQGLRYLFFAPEEGEQRAQCWERIQVSPPPFKCEW